MEKILVAINGRYGAWEALSHACSLAKRMDVQLNVLLVTPVAGKNRTSAEHELVHHIKQRLMLHIEQAKAEGIEIKCFFAEGNYADEVISFTNNNKITLLISEQERGGVRSNKHGAAVLSTMRHRVKCRMEVVAQKKTLTN